MSTEYSYTVYEKFKDAIKQYDMIGNAKSLLAGFSGGADSTTLLHILQRYSSEHGIKLYAAHVNHMIRGAEADRDEEFCRSFCDKTGIMLFVLRENVPEIAVRLHLGLEEAARTVRYNYFDKICSENRIELIATAHTASDNLETVLFNLSRGTGLNGLCGIPPVRGNIIRPLIFCSRGDINAYCAENGLAYVTDSTNADTSYSRNYIRSEIVPKLKNINPSLEYTVSRMSSLLRRDSVFLEDSAEKFSFSDGREALKTLDRAILSRVIKRECKAASGSPDSEQIKKIIDAINGNEVYCRSPVTGGIDFFADRGSLGFIPSRGYSIEGYDFELSPGINNLPSGGVVYLRFGMLNDSAAKEINQLINIYKLSIHITINSDKILGKIRVRTRKNGDSCRIGGMTRSVKKLLQSKKLTVAQRSVFPFICDDSGILWIPGFPPRDNIVKSEGSDTLTLYFIGGEAYGL